jgi:hypothetical protein
MAGLGHRAWIPGEVITADNIQQYLQDQSVQVYDNAAARGSALVGFVSEGMLSYLKDTNKVEYFDGSNWGTLKPDLFFSGSAGQYLKSSGTAGADWDTLKMDDIATDFQSKSAAYSIVAEDKNTFIRVSAAATVTIDNVLNAGESINFIQTGTGQITFSPGSDVTLLSKTNFRKTRSQYSAATVVGAGSGTYYLVGDLTA